MSEIKMKDGKISVSDRDKYRAMAVDTGNVLSIPPSLADHFKKEGLVSKWVSKSKIARHGGYHPSSWIPYEISDSQKKELPKVFLGNVISNCLERGDLILAVKPEELQEGHKKDLRRKTNQQLDAFHQELDAKGKPILREED